MTHANYTAVILCALLGAFLVVMGRTTVGVLIIVADLILGLSYK